MKFFLIFILTLPLFAFIDNDLDGVDDKIDQCPNTSFEDLVNEKGCPLDKIYLGTLTLELEQILQKEEESNHIQTFYLDYEYKNYLFTLSNAIYTINGINYNTDIYVNGGLKTTADHYTLKTYIGIKFPTGDKAISTQDKDYLITFNIDIFRKNLIYIFTSTYTLPQDETSSNYFNYSIGVDYNNIKLSYINSGSYTKQINQYQNIDINYNYNFTNKYYTKIGYNKSLLSNTNYSIYISLGVNFD